MPRPANPPALLLLEQLRPARRRTWGTPWMVLARSRCRLRWQNLAQLPAPERADALRVQASAWQPFDDCARVLLLQGEQGLVIAWDRAAAEAQLLAAGLDTKRYRLIPEPLLRQPQADGLHLLRCSEGYEAQQWLGGQLCASRWWPEQPGDEDWRQFLRSMPGQAATTARPEPVDAGDWLTRPWGQVVAGAGLTDDARRREARLVWLAAGAFALGGGFVGAQWFEVERALQLQQQANTALRQQLEPVLKQRERALQQAAQADVWAHWLRAPLPVELIQHLHESLARRQVQLREFELRGNKLRLGLLPPPQLPRAELLKAMQAGGWLTELTETRGEGLREGFWVEASISGPDLPTVAAPPGLAPAAQESPAPAIAAPALVAPSRAAAPAPAPAPAPRAVAARPAASDNDMPPASVFDAIK